MTDFKHIIKQFGVSYLFYIFGFILAPIRILLLTRNLSVEEYGVFSILLITVSIISVFLVLALQAFIITKFPSFNRQKRVKALFSLMAFELIFLVMVIMILFIPSVHNAILQFLKLNGYGFEFKLSLIIIFVSALYYLILPYLLANRKIGFHAFNFFIFRYFWIILLLFVSIFSDFNIQTILYLWLAGIVMSLIILAIYLKKDIALFFSKIKGLDFKLIKKALIFSIPLIPLSLLGYIVMFADRYMINYYHGTYLTGIYSLSYVMVGLIYSIVIILSGGLYPYISKAWHEKGNYQLMFNVMLKYNLIIILPAMVGLFILRNSIITLITTTEYLLGSMAIAILVPFPFFFALVEIYSQNLLLREKTKLILLINLGVAMLNIILNIFFIPAYGINGAAITTVISYVVMFTAFYYATKNQFVWNFKFINISKIIWATLIMGGGLVLMRLAPKTNTNTILSIILGLVVYVTLLFVLRVFVKSEYDTFKRFLNVKKTV